MKAIKFRQGIFWGGKFVKWHYWGFIEDDFILPLIPMDMALKNSLQYIYLKDIGDKEVYAEDIIKDEEGDIFVIKWVKAYSSEMWCAVNVEGKLWDFYGGIPDCFEIIGNNYENSYLLIGE